mgnify:CR=1 FL=1
MIQLLMVVLMLEEMFQLIKLATLFQLLLQIQFQSLLLLLMEMQEM